MGTWGTNLLANDTAADVRDTYMEFLKLQLDDDVAYHRTIEEYETLVGSDEEPLLWYALADVQWRTGRLLPEVRDHALYWIQNDGGVSLWEGNPAAIAKWKSTLQRLKDKLLTPMPARKRIPKPIAFVRNPWNIGDVYAYQFHTNLAKEQGFEGKYILLQKIGDVQYYKDVTFSAIQVYDRIFDTIPNLEVIEDTRLLPLLYSPAVSGIPAEKHIRPFSWYTKSVMLYEKRGDYPKKHLTYVGSTILPAEKYSAKGLPDLHWDKDALDEWFIGFHLSWRNLE